MRRRSISKQRGALDVFQIDRAEGRRNPFHRVHDVVGALGGEADGVGIDVRELLEEHAFPSMTGMAALGPMSPSRERRCHR